jgi:hypothetical protein
MSAGRPLGQGVCPPLPATQREDILTGGGGRGTGTGGEVGLEPIKKTTIEACIGIPQRTYLLYILL